MWTALAISAAFGAGFAIAWACGVFADHSHAAEVTHLVAQLARAADELRAERVASAIKDGAIRKQNRDLDALHAEAARLRTQINACGLGRTHM